MRRDSLARDHQGPRAVLNALQRVATSYAAPCDSTRQDLTIAEAQLRDYQARLGMPFNHESYMSALTSLRDQLRAGLAAPPAQQTTKAQPEPPTVSELAEQVKALKAANTIEATPQRAGKRRASAEEPVTARIRRRTMPAAASAGTSEPNAPATVTPTAPNRKLPSFPCTQRPRFGCQRRRMPRSISLDPIRLNAPRTHTSRGTGGKKRQFS